MDKDGSANAKAVPEVNLLRVTENGPLRIEAALTLNGVAAAGPRATLCRCGGSGNKPYCDGSHVGNGFRASGEPAVKDSQPLAARDGVVDVQPQMNGPLKVTGNLEIVSGTGRMVNRVTQVSLCRCGQSKNKPYCDGSHKAAGFQAAGV